MTQGGGGSDLLRIAVAGRGLLDRRAFLASAAAWAGGGGLLRAAPVAAASHAEAPGAEHRQPWMQVPGAPVSGYGVPSRHEGHVRRELRQRYGELAPGAGSSRTPLERLAGIITPNGLHFEVHHAGVPDIDPDQHRLLIHGRVRRPLSFDVEALLRYPTTSRLYFLECSGNSAFNTAPEPPTVSCGRLHGLVSCCEWTGVPLAVLLDEAGIEAGASWVIAEGADAVAMNRSIPLEKALDDALVALYQNGERLRPEQGYPLRLFLPGWEGNANVKWLRGLQVTDQPAQSRQETAKYTDLLPDGRARQFSFEMGVKSTITHPAGGLAIQAPGLYEISGLAWSGAGAIRQVEVSADGGATWASAALQEPVLSRCLTRFRIPWRWDGGPALLQSRATDANGARQPTRAAWLERYSLGNVYHYNSIQTWSVSASGEIQNVYA